MYVEFTMFQQFSTNHQSIPLTSTKCWTFPQAFGIIGAMKSGVETNRLNIFIDETGEFGLSVRSAKLYGISMVLHEQSADISFQVNKLEARLKELDFSKMIHLGDLINGHGDFEGMTVEKRKQIFISLYRFSSAIETKYHSIIFRKRFADDELKLQSALKKLIRSFIENNLEYLTNFNEVVVYYDGGQKRLSKIIDDEFGTLRGYRRKSKFDHREKKLFQVADMLTFVDKLIYKHRKHIKLTASERLFFEPKELKRLADDSNKKQISKTRKAPFRVLV